MQLKFPGLEKQLSISMKNIKSQLGEMFSEIKIVRLFKFIDSISENIILHILTPTSLYVIG